MHAAFCDRSGLALLDHGFNHCAGAQRHRTVQLLADILIPSGVTASVSCGLEKEPRLCAALADRPPRGRQASDDEDNRRHSVIQQRGLTFELDIHWQVIIAIPFGVTPGTGLRPEITKIQVVSRLA
jgi:hypothetical protein